MRGEERRGEERRGEEIEERKATVNVRREEKVAVNGRACTRAPPHAAPAAAATREARLCEKSEGIERVEERGKG